MTPKSDRVREMIAQEAADWFVANREGGLDPTQRATFAAWLRTSGIHVQEYLNIALIARDLREASNDSALSLEDLLVRANAAEPSNTIPMRALDAVVGPRWWARPWLSTAMAAAAVGILALAFLFWRGSTLRPTAATGNVYYLRTRHGEQLDRQLPDKSILHLNTDTAVWVLYDPTQRVVGVIGGQAEFEVTHDPARKFVVMAGTIGITAIGTKFEVYARPDATLVSVFEGRVAVEDQPGSPAGDQAASRRTVEVGPGQQIRVGNGAWPPTYSAVDAQRATAWLRRQIVFEDQPLGEVAAEFNRYAATPVEIETPALQTLAVSGAFAADDTETFIAFLRSLDGVQVEVKAAKIQVTRK